MKTDSVGGHLAIVPIPVIPNAEGVALIHVVNMTDGSVSTRGLQTVLVPQSLEAERPREPVRDSQISVTAGHVAISANTKVGKDEFQRQLPARLRPQADDPETTNPTYARRQRVRQGVLRG